MKHSKLQLQVLSLYKQCLRAAKEKPGFQESVRSEFRRNQGLARSDTLRIEYVMRIGYRKLDMIKDPNVSGGGSFVGTKK